MSKSLQPLTPDQLYTACDTADFDFVTTDELADRGAAMGQARALDALHFGVRMTGAGFNLYALGPAGQGKRLAIQEVIESEAGARAAPDDWCYVNHFGDPTRPVALRLPAGQGRLLARDVDQLLDELGSAIPLAFESEEYRTRAEKIEEEAKDREARVVNALRLEALPRQIALIETPTGFAFAPINDKSEVLSPEDFHELPEERQQEIQSAIAGFHEQLQKLLRQFPAWRREARQQLKALQHEMAAFAISHFVDEIKARYEGMEDARRHIEVLRQTLIEHADEFMPKSDGSMAALMGQGPEPRHLLRYRINLLVDNGALGKAPVVFESLPTHANLIGRIEHQAQMGTLVTDFSMIRAGALHRANGGYLVLEARKLLQQPFAWDALKRTLLAGEIRIESLERSLGLISTLSLEPAPIPLNVKVVLVGDRVLHYLLDLYDPEFRELFKVSADFEDDVARDPDSHALFSGFVANAARRNGLRPLDRDAVIRVVEHAARRAEDSEKLSSHLRSLEDLLKEADYWAGQSARTVMTRFDIQTAIDRQAHRLGRVRDRVYEEIRRGNVLIDTEGASIGQINALSIISLGELSFGQPSRITATTRLGGGKIVDIERETELGGAIHSKGVMILSSFLAARYARIQPLSLTASLVFEQSYGEVEGDSASLAELCVILSSLADLPIRQSLAITGSVNQHGQVQPIGGVNEKIEGFFDVCSLAGLTGRQGVIIPAANVKHLMLREDVVDAARQGQFRVYAVSCVDEALSLLLDTAAGCRDDRGEFPIGTVNGRVEQKLLEWAAIVVQLGHDNGGEG